MFLGRQEEMRTAPEWFGTIRLRWSSIKEELFTMKKRSNGVRVKLNISLVKIGK